MSGWYRSRSAVLDYIDERIEEMRDQLEGAHHPSLNQRLQGGIAELRVLAEVLAERAG